MSIPTDSSSSAPSLLPSAETILITGCSEGGIGSSLSLAFSQLSTPSRPLHVFATARNPQKLSHLSSDRNITCLTLDVTSVTSIAACVSEVSRLTSGGGLDVLVNNAGLYHQVPFLDQNLEAARELFEANFFGVIATTQEFSPLFIKRKGTVVMIGSIVGELRPPFCSIYSASKAALHSLSDSLRIELAAFDVSVVTVVAGAVASKSSQYRQEVRLPEGSLYAPIEAEFGNNNDEPKADNVDVWAGRLAKRILAGEKGKTWLGKWATIMWVITNFLWHGATDGMFKRRAGINKLRDIRRKEEEMAKKK